jgi:subfamily B ATP-binding cassette protein HlyB/CyaB
MFLYSPTLTAIAIGAFPFYIGISAFATPLFRQRLDEKFQRGAENQAFLVECVTGIETLKAMAIEPQMQRRWEEQLAGYVASSFRVLQLGNVASQSVQLVSKFVTAAVLYVGAKLVIGGDLTVAKGRTVFIIAHRLSAVRWTDRIITIDRGGLVEDGTHDELIKTGGRYATLHRLQAGVHAVS